MQHAVRLEASEVAGVQPSVLIDRLLILGQAVITVHQARPLDDDLADLALSGKARALVPDAHLVVGKAAAHGNSPLLKRIVESFHRDDRRAFGLAVTAQQLAAAEQLLEAHHLHRRRKSAADDAQIKLSRKLLLELRHGSKHAVDRADRAHIRNFIFIYNTKQRIRLQKRRQIHMRSALQISEDDHQPVAVEGGKRKAQRFADIFPEDHDTALGVAQDREGGLLHGLRHGRRSRGVNDHLRIRRLHRRIGLLQQGLILSADRSKSICPGKCRRRENVTRRHTAVRKRLHRHVLIRDADGIAADDAPRRVHHLRKRGNIRRLQAVIHQRRHAAGLHDTEEGNHPFDPVKAPDDSLVTLLKPRLDKLQRTIVRSKFQLSESHGLVTACDCRSVRKLLRSLFQEF